MTLTLILMRHAKSSWELQRDDHDRPLNGRGRDAAQTMGDWIKRQGYMPDMAVVSSSARTQETFARLRLSVPADVRQDLYLADAHQMLDVLKNQKQAAILIIGHNPGIADLAHRLVAQTPDHPRFADYPTGATTVMRWEKQTSWKNTGWHTRGKGGQPVDFAIPREVSQT